MHPHFIKSHHNWLEVLVDWYDERRIQRRVHTPLFEFFNGCIFGNFYSITRINFFVIAMQCLQYVFYSLLSLQKHRVCMKGHQNNLQTSKSIARRDHAPQFLNFWIRQWWFFLAGGKPPCHDCFSSNSVGGPSEDDRVCISSLFPCHSLQTPAILSHQLRNCVQYSVYYVS